jgi:hypothetical protein
MSRKNVCSPRDADAIKTSNLIGARGQESVEAVEWKSVRHNARHGLTEHTHRRLIGARSDRAGRLDSAKPREHSSVLGVTDVA